MDLGTVTVSYERGTPVNLPHPVPTGRTDPSSPRVLSPTALLPRALSPPPISTGNAPPCCVGLGDREEAVLRTSLIIFKRDADTAAERKGENLEGISPESQDQNLALTVLCVPSSLDSGSRTPASHPRECYLPPPSALPTADVNRQRHTPLPICTSSMRSSL